MASKNTIATSLSNAGGSSGKGLSRSNPRPNSTISEGNSAGGMKGQARRNGMMPGADSSSPDVGTDAFHGPYKTTNQDFRPTKTGSAC